MTFSSQNLTHVYYWAADNKHLMGRLLLKNRQIFFEYDASFIKLGFAFNGTTLSHSISHNHLFNFFQQS